MKLPRLWDWWAYALVAFIVIALTSPHNLETVVYKIGLTSLGLVLGYLADRAIFARVRDRIDQKMRRDIFSAARLLARALIVFAVVLGVTGGL